MTDYKGLSTYREMKAAEAARQQLTDRLLMAAVFAWVFGVGMVAGMLI